MTHSEALARMTAIAALQGDTELRHREADDLLCLILREMLWDEVADMFESFDKWYA